MPKVNWIIKELKSLTKFLNCDQKQRKLFVLSAGLLNIFSCCFCCSTLDKTEEKSHLNLEPFAWEKFLVWKNWKEGGCLNKHLTFSFHQFMNLFSQPFRSQYISAEHRRSRLFGINHKEEQNRRKKSFENYVSMDISDAGFNIFNKSIESTSSEYSCIVYCHFCYWNIKKLVAFLSWIKKDFIKIDFRFRLEIPLKLSPLGSIWIITFYRYDASYELMNISLCKLLQQSNEFPVK